MYYQTCLNKVSEFLIHRLKHYFGQVEEAPILADFWLEREGGHVFSDFMDSENLDAGERLILCLGLIPHLNPQFYTDHINSFLPQGGDLPIFGGIKGKNHRGVLPTVETIQFVLAGTSLTDRLRVWQYFHTSKLLEKGVLMMGTSSSEIEPEMSSAIGLTKEYVELFLTGKLGIPAFGPDFPAQKLETRQNWEDLVLSDKLREQIEELKNWVEHHQTLMNEWGMRKKLAPGYRVLFYGPPGTGKTLTASLLGKYTGWPVFRVNLSSIVSKYIGETEKNLEKLFTKAQRKNWILFFDEADALFGKRTGVNDSHDRYANQEVSYLLQRLENFEGLVILSTNFKSNMDEAFLRRFNAVIKYALPDAKQRQRIWEKSFPDHIPLAKNLDVQKLADHYELSGGNIINVVHRACLQTLTENAQTIGLGSVLIGIQREIEKEGRVFSPFPYRPSINGM